MTEIRTPNPSPPTPKGCLMLCNIGRVGDTILRNSILDAAFRTYATVDYICGPHNVDCVRTDSRLNQVTVCRNSPAGFMDVVKAALSRRYDGYIDLKNHCSSTSLIMARLFRSDDKTGCNGRHLRPFHRDVESLQAPDDHMVETMRRIGEFAGLQSGNYKPSLVLSPGSIAWFRSAYAWDRPFVFLNLSATHAHRWWPIENWVRFVRGCGLAGQPILINGLPKDQDKVQQLCQELPGAVSFLPRCFMDVAAGLADARLVVTVDTGVVHACSALDKPVVAFFCAGTSGTVYGPLSTRHLIIRPPSGGIVPDIDPDQAIAEAQRYGLL